MKIRKYTKPIWIKLHDWHHSMCDWLYEQAYADEYVEPTYEERQVNREETNTRLISGVLDLLKSDYICWNYDIVKEDLLGGSDMLLGMGYNRDPTYKIVLDVSPRDREYIEGEMYRPATEIEDEKEITQED